MVRFDVGMESGSTTEAPIATKLGLRRSSTTRSRAAKKRKRKRAKHSYVKSALTWLDVHLPIVLPTDRKRRYWDFLILAFVIYNAVSVPHEASFRYTKSRIQSRMEDVIDVLFALDVIYNFRTAYVDEQGVTVREGGKIVKNYLKLWCPIDVLASLPLEWIILLINSESNTSNLTYFAFLKTPRLLRLGRLLRFLEKIKNANVFRIVRLMLLMCLIAHWIACLWHMLIIYNPDVIFSIERSEDVLDEYLSCFYGAFLLMVGDNVGPLNNTERVFCCVVLVVGACFYATVVGNMALLVSNSNATAARHQQRAEVVQEAMRYLKVSGPVVSRVQDYYDYLQAYSHPGPEIMLYMADLPLSMFQDLASELYMEMISKVPLFSGTTKTFRVSICLSMRMKVYLAGARLVTLLSRMSEHAQISATVLLQRGEAIVDKGTFLRSMFFVQKGKVALLSAEGLIEAVLRKGAHFCDDSVIEPRHALRSALAMANADIMELPSGAVSAALNSCAVSMAAVRANIAALRTGAAASHQADAAPQTPLPALTLDLVAGHVLQGGTQQGSGDETSTSKGFSGTDALPMAATGASAPDVQGSSVLHTTGSTLVRVEKLLDLLVAKLEILEITSDFHTTTLKQLAQSGSPEAGVLRRDTGDHASAKLRLVSVARSLADEVRKMRTAASATEAEPPP